MVLHVPEDTSHDDMVHQAEERLARLYTLRTGKKLRDTREHPSDFRDTRGTLHRNSVSPHAPQGTPPDPHSPTARGPPAAPMAASTGAPTRPQRSAAWQRVRIAGASLAARAPGASRSIASFGASSTMRFCGPCLRVHLTGDDCVT